MSVPSRISAIAFSLSLAAPSPISGLPPAPKPRVSPSPSWIAISALLRLSAWAFGVHRNELDANNAFADHAVDGIASSATDADDLKSLLGSRKDCLVAYPS